jgi:hypothetical protein
MVIYVRYKIYIEGTAKDEAVGGETAFLGRFEDLFYGADKAFISWTDEEYQGHD